RNMVAAGVYSRKAHRAYFQNVARHLANGVRVFSLNGDLAAVQRLADHDVGLDETIAPARAAMSQGRGGLIAPAYCVNYLVSLVRLSRDLPVSIYLRWSKDPRKVELKRRWCE